MNQVTSKHLRGATELMLLVPVKSGFVQGTAVPYAERLRLLLAGLFDFQRSDVEEKVIEGAGPIDRLRSIFSTQWAVLDAVQPPQLLITACFDRSWEDYVQILVRETGRLLDAIFCHCVDYAGHTCVVDGFEAFALFLRQHQIPSDFFHTATPDLTVDDLRYLKKIARSNAGDPADVVVGELLGAPNASLPIAVAAKLSRLGMLFPAVQEMFGDPRTAQQIVSEAVDELRLQPRPTVVVPPAQLNDEDFDSIQGNILTPYPRMSRGCVLLVACETPKAAAALLDALSRAGATDVEAADLRATTEVSARSVPKVFVNVALTYAGLGRFGVGDELLGLFPKEFQEGMDQRAGLIGDVGDPNQPCYWELQPALLAAVDMVLILQWAREDVTTEQQIALLRLRQMPGVTIPVQQDLQRKFEKNGEYREHFGFLDSGRPGSGSQPVPDARRQDGKPITESETAPGDLVPLGELLLGYPGRDGKVARCTDAHTLGDRATLFKNGTFLVMRKLEQHVAEFETYANVNAQALGIVSGGESPSDQVKGLLVGRKIDGTPLVGQAAGQPPNAFDYSSDPKGAQCPLHAHMRRANPRSLDAGQAVAPRIMRRGFSYGAPYVEAPAGKRGLLFMAYNASIARQFEVIQRWIGGGNSTGIASAQNDLLSGAQQPPDVTRWVKVDGVSKHLTKATKPFVSLRWGLYLFVPSVVALRWLAERLAPDLLPEGASEDPIVRGTHLIAELDSIGDVERAKQAWKQRLEGRDRDSRADAAAMWASIRKSGKGKLTPYAFLVATAADAQAVLSDKGSHFSVREYWARLMDTIGEHYIGLDAQLGYVQTAATDRDQRYEARLKVEQVTYPAVAERPNAYLENEIPGEKAYDDSFEYAKAAIQRCVASGTAVPPRANVDVEVLAAVVVGRLAQAWIGLPLPAGCGDLELAGFMKNFVVVSEYCFQPYPDAALAQQARACGRVLRESYAATGPLKDNARMATYMRAKGEADEGRIERAMIGAIVGFAAPAIASIVEILVGWMNRSQLFDLSRSYKKSSNALGFVFDNMIPALEHAPEPPILYRTALADARVGGATLDDRTMVVIGLQSAVADARIAKDPKSWKWIFGGDHGGCKSDRPNLPVHGCPARPAALDAMAGILAAVLELNGLQREGPTVLSFTP
jgi:deferrochelatase/peroxidase EfeB